MSKSNVFEEIYQVVRQIPKGKVATYGQVSNYLQVDPRVVGWALHANKNLITPCHRVVNKEGRVAKNYAFGGEKKQKEKLQKEGVGFTDSIHVNLSKYGIMEI